MKGGAGGRMELGQVYSHSGFGNLDFRAKSLSNFGVTGCGSERTATSQLNSSCVRKKASSMCAILTPNVGVYLPYIVSKIHEKSIPHAKHGVSQKYVVVDIS